MVLIPDKIYCLFSFWQAEKAAVWVAINQNCPGAERQV